MEGNNTPKYLVSASGFELERIMTALNDNGIPNDSKPKKRNFSAKAVTGVDNYSEQDIYVPENAYEKAYDLCVGIGAIKLDGDEQIIEEEFSEATEEPMPSEEFEDMPSGKRTLVRVLSAALFVIIVALVIFGTDAITGWIQGLFS